MRGSATMPGMILDSGVSGCALAPMWRTSGRVAAAAACAMHVPQTPARQKRPCPPACSIPWPIDAPPARGAIAAEPPPAHHSPRTPHLRGGGGRCMQRPCDRASHRTRPSGPRAEAPSCMGERVFIAIPGTPDTPDDPAAERAGLRVTAPLAWRCGPRLLGPAASAGAGQLAHQHLLASSARAGPPHDAPGKKLPIAPITAEPSFLTREAHSGPHSSRLEWAWGVGGRRAGGKNSQLPTS